MLVLSRLQTTELHLLEIKIKNNLVTLVGFSDRSLDNGP